MRRAVLYARFSCSKQREASIEDQLRECHTWCARNGYAVVNTYCDYAMSGTTDERPQFQRMVANAGESDIVLVYMMDRFSREPYNASVYKQVFLDHGVRVVSAVESVPEGPDGIIMEKILEGMAAAESARTSIRTKRGMEGNARKCLANGVRVFGYKVADDGRFAIDEEEAPFVREAFDRRAKGETCNSIAMDFRHRGVRTSTGAPASYSFVHTMLQNPKYKGVYKFGDVVIEDGMPAIVSAAEWNAVQGIRGSKNRADEDWDAYPLTGRLHCLACGGEVSGRSGHGRNGAKYSYYACKNGCFGYAPARALEEEVLGIVRSLLNDDAETARVANRLFEYARNDEGLAARRNRLQKTLQKSVSGQRNILAAIEQGIAPKGTRERLTELEAEEENARTELAKLEIAGEVYNAEMFEEFLHDCAAMEDGKVIDLFVRGVYISREEAYVVLDWPSKKSEPMRFDLQSVRSVKSWLPKASKGRTIWMGCGDGLVLVRYDRAT